MKTVMLVIRSDFHSNISFGELRIARRGSYINSYNVYFINFAHVHLINFYFHVIVRH